MTRVFAKEISFRLLLASTPELECAGNHVHGDGFAGLFEVELAPNALAAGQVPMRVAVAAVRRREVPMR